MARKTSKKQPAHLDPASISRNMKEKHLLSLSEEVFRDRVVRPLFLKRGFRNGRETCGMDELGKDMLFTDKDKLGNVQIHVVQTKKGKLNLSSKVNQNVVTAATQIQTALNTKVPCLSTKTEVLPDFAYLCASGRINEKAKAHICGVGTDPHIHFMDADVFIDLIDTEYPEFWWSIDPDRFPYLKKLKEDLLDRSDTISLAEIEADSQLASPIADGTYVPLYLNKMVMKSTKRKGKTSTTPRLEQMPAEKIIRQQGSLIHITGEAGAGKTTVLRRLAYVAANRSLSTSSPSTIPIVLKAVDISSKSNRLVDIAAARTVALSQSGKTCFDDEDLHTGKLIILVDALDEAPSDHRSAVLGKLLEFHSDFPKCEVIFTSRNYSSIFNLPEVSHFERWEVTPIDLKQAEKMLRRLSKGKKLQVEVASEMLRRLHDVHGINLSPLLVTVFVATSDYHRRDVPANITELLKKFTEMMLGRWDERKGVAQQYQAPVKDFLLKQLAFNMHSQHLTRLPLSVCKELMQKELKDTGHDAEFEKLFKEIVFRSGLLRSEDDNVAFRHALLQEFFAGRAAPGTAYFKDVVSDEWWRHPILFYFGEHPEAHYELAHLIDDASNLEGSELYRAAIAIGLAIQGCYLSRVTDKNSSMEWVISSLARAHRSVESNREQEGMKYPLLDFVEYYIIARDAVACSAFIKTAFEKALSMMKAEHEEADLEAFWCIVSLIESGKLDAADELIAKYHPSDRRLLLALHLGCFLTSELRIACAADRKKARHICNILAPKIAHLGEQFRKEFGSMLLEVRHGQLSAIPEPT